MQRQEILKKYPTVFYFSLCYGISWTGALIVALPTLLSHQPFQKMVGLIMFPVMLVGPATAGLILTYLQLGRTGIRALGRRMLRWKVRRGTYLFAFILPPVLILLVLNFLSHFISPVFTPNFFPWAFYLGFLQDFWKKSVGWGLPIPRSEKNFLLLQPH